MDKSEIDNEAKNNFDPNFIRLVLINSAEPEYKNFAQKLIPGCDNLLGVRIPTIRKIAQQIAKGNPISYLHNAKSIYFEESMLKALIVGNMNCDTKILFKEIENLLPEITNWSLCDSLCRELKIVRKYKKETFTFLNKYLTSDNPNKIRFGVVMLIFHFIESDYLEEIFDIINSITCEDYYVKMASAWAISMCYIYDSEKTMIFLKNNSLDNFTFNKSLQKIVESLQVSKENKEIIKGMKRRK